MSMLDQAVEYYLSGYSVLRTRRDKTPVGHYRRFLTDRPTPSHLEAWFGTPDESTSGLAVVLGSISNNLVAIDFDGSDWEWAFSRLAELFPKLKQTRWVRTASGKRHVWFYLHSVDFTREVYSWRDVKDFAIELRGNTMLAVAPPSFVEIPGKYSGQYEFENPETEILQLDELETAQLREVLHTHFRCARVRVERTLNFLSQGSEPGSQDEEAFQAALQLRDHGYHRDDAFLLIRHALVDLSDSSREPWDDEGVENIIHQVYSRGPREITSVGGDEAKLSEYGDHHLFVRLFGDEFLYCEEMGSWCYWNGTIWDFRQGPTKFWDSLEELHKERRKQMEMLGITGDDQKPWIKRISSLQTTSTMSSVETLLRRDGRLLRQMDQFDQHPQLLAVGNGILDLRGTEPELVPPTREFMLTNYIPVEYHDDAQCPTWLKFLERVFRSDPDAVRYIQAAVGYSLTGDTSEHCFFILYGGGRNGKGTLVDTILSLMSGYGLHPSIEAFMSRNFIGGIRDDIAQMAGKRFVTAGEPPPGKSLDSGTLKALTGEDIQTARHLYKKLFSFTPQMKIWLLCNTLPDVEDTSFAFWDRVKVIPFLETITLAERDRHLREKLEAELEGILAWAVEGWKIWRQSPTGLRGLETDSIRSATLEYRASSDPIGTFVTIFYEDDDDSTIDADLVFGKYQVWSGETGITKTKLTRALHRLGFQSVMMGGRRVFTGIREKEAVDYAPRPFADE